jgi:hypothetical protein
VFPIIRRLKNTFTAAFILVVQYPAAVLTYIQATIMVTDIGNFFLAVLTQEVLIFKNQVTPTPFTCGQENG